MIHLMSSVKNNMYKVSNNDLLKAEQRMNTDFPDDLKRLYLEVGYGCIKGQSTSAINRILGPGAVADIYLRESIFEFDPDLDELYDENKLIFFEVNEGVYISLDLKEKNNPVYYFDIQIAASLEDFLEKFMNHNEYYLDLIKN